MFRKNIISYIVLLLIIGSTASLQAQNLIKYVNGTPVLTVDQLHYYNEAMKSPFAVESVFATIDFSVLQQNTINLNLPNELYITFVKEDRELVPEGRISWIGREPGSMGAVHFAYEKGSENLVGQLQVDDVSYVISPLSNGLHAIIRYDMAIDENCLTPAGKSNYDGPNPPVQGNTYGIPDIINNQTGSSSERVTGECNIRLLVAYTDDVDANRVDIYSDIVTMINTANTGYMNSELPPGASLGYRVELAVAYEEVYAESNNMNTDLNRLTNTSDGFLDDVHTNRNLWEADQCVLLTANGSGLAWVNLAYGDQMSVTGQGNFFAHTFHHETGHNAECTHALNQTTQPGTAPYAGWGEPGNCFRTVLAYAEACPSGSCPRHNIFSDNDVNQWTCNSTSYTPGTINNRNQDRLVLSAPTIVGYEVVPASVSYSGDYNWFVREGVHFAGGTTLSYSSTTNRFEFFSGSTGTFRAGGSVTLGTGFWARAGSDFTAYLENCTPLRSAGDELAEQLLEDVKNNLDAFNWNVYPNPLNNYTLIEFNLPEEQDVKMVLYDMQGKLLKTIYDNVLMSEGPHSYELDASLYEPGIYFLYLTGDKLNESKRLLIQR